MKIHAQDVLERTITSRYKQICLIYKSNARKNWNIIFVSTVYSFKDIIFLSGHYFHSFISFLSLNIITVV